MTWLGRAASGPVAGDIGEDALIALFAADAGIVGSEVLVPNGDDAAVFLLDSKLAAVVTTDSLVERVHFDFSYCPPHAVGRKLIGVNLSDIAAMGAEPRYALLSVTLAPSTPVEMVQAIARGIGDQCRAHGVAVVGGNTTHTDGPMVLTATIAGRIEPDQIARRRGTRVGDGLYVTGHLGDAHAGLSLARAGAIPQDGDPLHVLYVAHIDPEPRVAAGRALAQSHLVHAMCDISDGLGRDLGRLLHPEGLGARIDARALPMSDPMRAHSGRVGLEPERVALEGGEDYELLFSADPENEERVTEVLARVGTPVARVGTVTASRDIEVSMPDGSVISLPDGYDHFRTR